MLYDEQNFEQYIDKAFDVYIDHVGRFEERYTSGGILPGKQVWRPYRFATRDVIVGMSVIKHNSKGNFLEVDVCLVHTPDVFEFYEGTRVMLSFLLSEAFKCGGTMGIKFSENVEGGRVPGEICDYAVIHGIKLNNHNVFKGILTPADSRKLYLAVTKLSPEAITKVMALAVEKKFSPERACYMIQNGIWSLQQAEILLLGAKWPDDVLLGSYPPELRHLHLQCLNEARMAVLGGFLDIKLKTRKLDTSGEDLVDLEGDEVQLGMRFNPTFFASEYVTEESIQFPWLVETKPRKLGKGKKLSVLLRPRDKAEIAVSYKDDLKAAVLALESSTKLVTMILYPHDYFGLPEKQRGKIEDSAREAKVHIGVCPETLASISKDATAKLEQSRILRMEV